MDCAISDRFSERDHSCSFDASNERVRQPVNTARWTSCVRESSNINPHSRELGISIGFQTLHDASQGTAIIDVGGGLWLLDIQVHVSADLFNTPYSKLKNTFPDIVSTSTNAPWETLSYKSFVDLVGQQRFFSYLHQTNAYGRAAQCWKNQYFEKIHVYRRVSCNDWLLSFGACGDMTIMKVVSISQLGPSTILHLDAADTKKSIRWETILDFSSWVCLPFSFISLVEAYQLNKCS